MPGIPSPRALRLLLNVLLEGLNLLLPSPLPTRASGLRTAFSSSSSLIQSSRAVVDSLVLVKTMPLGPFHSLCSPFLLFNDLSSCKFSADLSVSWLGFSWLFSVAVRDSHSSAASSTSAASILPRSSFAKSPFLFPPLSSSLFVVYFLAFKLF